MFKKNTAVTGFKVGLVSSTDGSDITTGTPVGYYTLDGGAQSAIGDVTPTHKGNGEWAFDLLAAEMNGDVVGLTFTHASAITEHFTISTATVLVSELNDVAATDIVSAGAIITAAGSVVTVDTTTTNTDMVSEPLDAAGTRSAIGLAAANLDTQLADLPTVAEFQARTILAAAYFDPAVDAVANVTLVATTTTNTDMRGTESAALASVWTVARAGALTDWLNGGRLDTILDATKADTASIALDTVSIGTPSDFGSGTATLAGNLEDLADNGTAVYDRSTDSLQAIRDRGDASWVTGAGGTGLSALAEGTAQSGTASTIVLAGASTFADNELNGNVVNILTGTGAGQSRAIVSNTLSDDTCNIYPNWATNPANDSTYEIVQGSTNVSMISLDGPAADNLESAAENYSVTRGLTGTAVPAVAADGVGGLPISDAGGLDLDAIPVAIDRNADLGESRRGWHTWQGNVFYYAPTSGSDANPGTKASPKATLQAVHDDLFTDYNHDVAIFLADNPSGPTTHDSGGATTTLSKNYCFVRGPGRDGIHTRTGNGPTFTITGDGVELSGFQLASPGASGTSSGIDITLSDFVRVHHVWFLDTNGDGIHCDRGNNCQFHDNHFEGTGATAGSGIHISSAGAGNANDNQISRNHFADVGSEAILVDGGISDDTTIRDNVIHDSGTWGISVAVNNTKTVILNNCLGNNSSGDIQCLDTTAIIRNNSEWLAPTVQTTAASVQRTLDVNAAGEAGLDLDNTSGTIDAAQIGADAITNAKISDDAIAAENLATGALTADAFAADAIVAATLATGALTADAFAANALIAATFAASSLDGKGDWNTVVPDVAGTAPTATEIVDEWETQSQADPTGFHVNVLEVGGTAQTANDNGADINAILAQTGTTGVVLTAAERNSIADATLNRGASNIEGTADRHSLGSMIMIGTNASLSGTTLTAKKPSDDTTFATYTVTVDAAADPVTGVS